MTRVIVIALLACNLILLGVHTLGNRSGAVDEVPAQTPDETPPLVLLRELGPAGSPGGDRQCFSAGPFETRSATDAARGELAPLVDRVVERESETLIELGYWVSLPPMPSFSTAGAALQQLRDAGLQDLAVVTDADGEYRVSLGYFLDENNARRRRNRVRDLGFEASTRLVRETEPRYWLDYDQPRKSPPASIILGDRLSRSLHREIPCPLQDINSL